MRKLIMGKRWARYGQDRRGMTLVELLLVMAIFSVVTLALAESRQSPGLR